MIIKCVLSIDIYSDRDIRYLYVYGFTYSSTALVRLSIGTLSKCILGAIVQLEKRYII